MRWLPPRAASILRCTSRRPGCVPASRSSQAEAGEASTFGSSQAHAIPTNKHSPVLGLVYFHRRADSCLPLRVLLATRTTTSRCPRVASVTGDRASQLAGRQAPVIKTTDEVSVAASRAAARSAAQGPGQPTALNHGHVKGRQIVSVPRPQPEPHTLHPNARWNRFRHHCRFAPDMLRSLPYCPGHKQVVHPLITQL